MDEIRVGIREFRARLPHFLLEIDAPVAITRHGKTVGYFIPHRDVRVAGDTSSYLDAVTQVEKLLADKGVSEEDVLEEFRRQRLAQRV